MNITDLSFKTEKTRRYLTKEDLAHLKYFNKEKIWGESTMDEHNTIKPKGQNKLTKDSIEEFKKCLKSIKNSGRYQFCPVDMDIDDSRKLCEACHQAFPKNYFNCPCLSNYSKNYLIRRVKEIIKTGKI